MRLGVATVMIVAAVVAGDARAQEDVRQKPAISVERFTPPPGQAAYLGADDPDTLPCGVWAFGASLSYAARPIVLRDYRSGVLATVPVAWRLGLELGGAVGFGERWQVGAALPVLLQDGDRLRGIGLSEKKLDRAAFGDARVYGKARLAGAPGDLGIAAAASVVVVLPTGDDGDFAGEQGTVVEWRIAGGWRAERWAIAANAGARFRSEEVVLLSPSRPNGNELIGALAGEVAVPVVGSLIGGDDRVWAIGEVEAVLGDSIGGASVRGPSPVEARWGVRARVSEGWSVSAGMGAGLTPAEVGSPAWRVMAMATYSSGAGSAGRGDWDGDGVRDDVDRCVAEPEDRDGWADSDGCPDPDDDVDGIPDDEDKCPREAEDFDGYDDADGCPDHEERLDPPAPIPTQAPDRSD